MATYHHQKPLVLVFLFCYSLSMAFQLHYCRAAAYVESGRCKRKCGHMDIPYPFGIGSGCYIDEMFAVACNESTHTVTSRYYGFDIDFISVPDHLVRTTNGELTARLYDESGETVHDHYMNISADVFSLPNLQIAPNRNKLVFLGCDLYAYVVDSDTRKFLGGCSSLCNRTDIAPSDPTSCSGLGCCQLNFPEHTRNFTMWYETMNTVSRSWANECISMGIADKDSFSVNQTKASECSEPYMASLTFEWYVPNISCTNISSGCGRHSSCHNSSIGVGYLCKCLHGFTGNPYILDGCTDIDECKGPEGNRCPQNTHCSNTDGSYECLALIRTHATSTKLIIILGTSLAVGLLTLVSVGLWLHRKLKKIMERKLKIKFFKRNGGLLLQQQACQSSATIAQIESKLFKADELEKATNNFCESRVLGKGGLGTVYKGMLQDGSIVAVKIANVVDESQVGQFINEVFILSEIKHRHIIRLLGCCLETQVPRLVYEYVSNGTLHQHLHSFPNSNISWENRLRIAAEIAGALAYLHSYASTAIIHRDIKSSNILLDENYRAVVSDFGLSRSVSTDRTHITTVVGGTFGYLDPEYYRSGQLTDKSDVYAFGVILAELLTGRKPISSIEDEGSLVICFQTVLEEGRLSEILDQNVAGEAQEEEITVVAQLCGRCIQLNSRPRPSMRYVAAELERLRRTKEEVIRYQDNQFPAVMERCDSSFISSDYEAEDDPILSYAGN